MLLAQLSVFMKQNINTEVSAFSRLSSYTRWNNFLFLYRTATCTLHLSITDTFGMKVNALICKYTVEPQIKPNAVISKVSLIQ